MWIVCDWYLVQWVHWKECFYAHSQYWVWTPSPPQDWNISLNIYIHAVYPVENMQVSWNNWGGGEFSNETDFDDEYIYPSLPSLIGKSWRKTMGGVWNFSIDLIIISCPQV